MSKYLPEDIRIKLADKFPVLKNKAYFNAAAVGPWPLETQDAVRDYLETWAELDDPTPRVFDYWREIRPLLAGFINAPTEQVEFAYNTSHGLSIAANGIDWKAGDQIILSDVEFPANTYPWTNLRREGVEVKFIKSNDMCFDINAFEREITSRTRMLTLSSVQYFNGFRNDLERLGEICTEQNIFFLVDGIQGVGNIPIDVQKCRIDFRTASDHPGCHHRLAGRQGSGRSCNAGRYAGWRYGRNVLGPNIRTITGPCICRGFFLPFI